MCYTAGQCDNGYASSRYQGFYWKECDAPHSDGIHPHQPSSHSPPSLPEPCPKDCAQADMGNGYCNVECYRVSCEWDRNDCEPHILGHGDTKKEVTSQCADGCPPYMIKDGTCDEACNVEACLFDGNQLTLLNSTDPKHVSGDCDHGHDECYTDPKGTDYQGTVSTTEDGDECLVWDHKIGIRWARDLGGHNFCRNPKVHNNGADEEKTTRGDRPWCFTLDQEFFGASNNSKRWGYCKVQDVSEICGDHSFRTAAKFWSAEVSAAFYRAHDLGRVEIFNEASAAPLITAALIVVLLLFTCVLVLTQRTIKVWRLRARESRDAPHTRHTR